MEVLSARSHPTMRTLVSQLSAFLPPSKRDGGTGIEAMTTLAVFRWVQEYNPEIDGSASDYCGIGHDIIPSPWSRG